jgi:hypothetical protein
MKKFLSLILILFFVGVLSATNTDATVTQNDKTGESITFGFTATTSGTNTITVDFSSFGFTFAEYFDLPATIRIASGETTADSIRWNVYFQAKAYPTDTWFNCQTFVDTNSTTPFINVTAPNTYGYWPYCRIYMQGAAAKNASQTITGDVVFNKNQ